MNVPEDADCLVREEADEVAAETLRDLRDRLYDRFGEDLELRYPDEPAEPVEPTRRLSIDFRDRPFVFQYETLDGDPTPTEDDYRTAMVLTDLSNFLPQVVRERLAAEGVTTVDFVA